MKCCNACILLKCTASTGVGIADVGITGVGKVGVGIAGVGITGVGKAGASPTPLPIMMMLQLHILRAIKN